MFDWLKLWFDQKRIAPKGQRGRVFEKRQEDAPSNGPKAKAEPVAYISARVYRASTGKWEIVNNG